MAIFETWLKNDLKQPVKVEKLEGNLFSADSGGNLIGVEVYDNGQPASLSGAVTGYILRADGTTVILTGTLSGNKASIVLPSSAYVIIGWESIVIKVGTTTVGACMAYVYQTTTDELVDPEHIIPSIEELYEMIEECDSVVDTKADKVANPTNGHFAGLDSNGNLTDSGYKPSDFILEASGKADKVSGAISGDIASLDSSGNLMDSGSKVTDFLLASSKGANNGVAELDSSGKVPSAQLPGFVDDVLEYSSRSAFPATGEAGKIYIAQDTNKTYRWSGSVYVEISASLALGETSSTAYRGDYGKVAHDHATESERITTTQPEGLYKFSVTAEGHVKGVSYIQKSDITALGIPGDISGKADRVALGVTGNFASLDSDGNLADSGSKASDFLTAQDITGKADKVATVVAGNFAELDASGNLLDSGSRASDFVAATEKGAINGVATLGSDGKVPSAQLPNIDVSAKADKVANATSGNFAGLDNTGNLTDSGHKASDFLTAHQDISGKADKVASATSGHLAGLDSNGNLTDSGSSVSDLDDVLEYASESAFPASGTAGKIYVAKDSNELFRWDTTLSEYVSVGGGGGGGTVTDVQEDGTSILSSGVANILTMSGAGASSAGSKGLVPAPSAGDDEKYLKGDGTWGTPAQRSDSSIVDLVYPVGSVYISTNSTSPATLFGGTWSQLKDSFLLGAGDTYTAGDTGGAASASYTPSGTVGSHTLTTDEIPSHNHSFTGSEVTSGNQSADHTHTYTDYYATTTGNRAITTAQTQSHSHNGKTSANDIYAKVGSWAGNKSGWMNITDAGYNNNTDAGTNKYLSGAYHSHTIDAVGSGNNHNHSGENTSTSRTSNGVSANHTHKVTASGSIGNTGGGLGHDHSFTGTAATIATMPPYITVYMWERTA